MLLFGHCDEDAKLLQSHRVYSINLISERLKLAMNRKASAPSMTGPKLFAVNLPVLASRPIAADATERNVVAATIHAWASAGTGWAKIATDPKTLTHAIAQATSSSSALVTALAAMTAEAAIPSSHRTPNVMLCLAQATAPTMWWNAIAITRDRIMGLNVAMPGSCLMTNAVPATTQFMNSPGRSS